MNAPEVAIRQQAAVLRLTAFMNLAAMPALPLDVRAYEASAREVREFEQRGERRDLNESWKHGNPYFEHEEIARAERRARTEAWN